MWAAFVCFPLFAFCQLFNSSAAQWPVLFRISESLKQYLLLGMHICSFCQLLVLFVKTHSWALLRCTIFFFFLKSSIWIIFWNDICETQKTQSSLHTLSLFSTTPFSKDFPTQRKNSFLLVLTRHGGSTETSSDKERCRPLLTEEPKTADNGIKNCWQRGGRSTDGSKKTGETGPKNWRQMSRAGPKKRVKRRSEQRVDGFVDWGYNLCVFHRYVWQHSFCKERIKCTPIRVMNQDSIIHAGILSHQIMLKLKLT